MTNKQLEDVANGIAAMMHNWRNVGQQEPSPREIAKTAIDIYEATRTPPKATKEMVEKVAKAIHESGYEGIWEKEDSTHGNMVRNQAKVAMVTLGYDLTDITKE